jgi:glycosyltransferase involved in cell wall biosynthesis
MIEAGLPAARVKVKPNFYPGMPDVFPWAKRNSYVVYAGRLTAEKGVENLVRTWRLWGIEAPTLYILGDGNLKSKLEDMAVGLPIRFLGQVDERKAQSYIARAKLLVLPSECFEGFPMVVREAFAFGTPVAVSNIGPLPTIVRHGSSGVIFESASPESLLQQVRTVWEKPEVMACMGMAARAEYESKYTEVANYEMLMSIYEHAISISKGQQAQKVY